MVHDANPTVIRGVISKCLTEGIFPHPWKEARLILIKKGNKPDNEPSSYRPLCLLDNIGKILKLLLADRLEAQLATRAGLAKNQFGFQKGKSIDDVAIELRNTALAACNNGAYCVAISLDVKNAFNTLPRREVLKAFQAWTVTQY